MVIERTLVLLKPDAIARGLIGRIISRFEDTGLKIVGMKMIWVDEEVASKHYYIENEWAKQIFEKTKKSYEAEGKPFPYKEPIEIAKIIQKWNMHFLSEGPIIAMVLEGPHAVELVRKLIGSTEPKSAQPGTIRGDFASVESYALADSKKRVVRNLIHASDSKKNAEREISIWFSPGELHSYSKELDKYF